MPVIVTDPVAGDSSNQYYILVSSAVFYYDFILTMPQEIKHIWSSKAKLNLVNVLVIALRYITAFGYVPVLMLALSPADAFSTEEKCDKFGKLPAIIGIICQGLTLVFLIIRLYAIFDKKSWILYATVPFGLLNVVLSILAIASEDEMSFVKLRNEPGVEEEDQIASFSCFATPNFARSGETLQPRIHRHSQVDPR